MKKLKDTIKHSNKLSLTVYLTLRLLTIICLIREFWIGNYENAVICIFALILFLVPSFLEKTLKVDFPTTLEVLIFLFIFSAEILGEINNFYGKFEMFDDILHTINGFACASIGFSLVYILNENIKSIKLSPFFVSLVAFCFSMTIGVFWEFFEFAVDNTINLDMQKDQYIEKINTVTLDKTESNKVITIDNIAYTIMYDKDGKELVKIDNYLDIGLNDTMEDLIVNFIGAFTYSVFGYLYIVNNQKYKLAGEFITKKSS